MKIGEIEKDIPLCKYTSKRQKKYSEVYEKLYSLEAGESFKIECNEDDKISSLKNAVYATERRHRHEIAGQKRTYFMRINKEQTELRIWRTK